ncbi:MAG: GTPase ObgE, partial [Clostridia bacterium]|nr:GTPase ObgE [Clostridia bacterium]
KYVASGGPDGGDGGKGGDIVFMVDDNLSTLADFKYKRKYKAPNGMDGQGGRRNGKKGEDLIIKVPLGTIIREVSTGKIMADLSDDKPFIAAKGGRGGWGNPHFATATRQAPRFAKSGTPGEEWEVSLELKLIADVGLLGFPNVGKSSFISVVSEAKPIVADYHFTTITPVLGVVRMGEGNSFVIADIPGLIEGASEGIGLGHEFLRHVERCRMLVHILDAAGSEGRDPIEDFEKINLELARFNEELATREQIVVANKIDLATDEQLDRLEKYMAEHGYKLYRMCAPIVEGTQEVINAVAAKLATLPPVVRFESEEIKTTDLLPESGENFTVRCEDDVYFVEGEWLLRILQRTDLDDYESLQYFQRVLETSGILDRLVEMGINEGDSVVIYDFEFDYVP